MAISVSWPRFAAYSRSWLHGQWPIRISVLAIFTREGGRTGVAVRCVDPLVVWARTWKVSRWAFDIRRVRRFAGFLSIVSSPARSARLAEIASNYLSHIAPRSKPFYPASPEPLPIWAGDRYDAVLLLQVSADLRVRVGR